MAASRALSLCCAMAEASVRLRVAGELARELGAEALLVLLRDEEVDALLPAPGFPQTLPGGASWYALLDQLTKPGLYVGEVAYPDGRTLSTARALVTEQGLVLVLVGGNPRIPTSEELALPLLHATLKSELLVAASRGRLAVERAAARHANELANALDGARRQHEESNAALKAANRSKDEFLAMLGHELRNPLAPIVTALQLLKMRGELARSREYAVISRQVHHLARLVDDLLDVSRITRGKVTLKKEPVELWPVVQKAVEMAAPLLEERGHHLSVDVPATGLPVDGDEGRLAQVLSNLLTNAARYTPPGGKISLYAVRERDRIVCRVRDSGIGIDARMLKSIFDLFVQGAQDRDRAEGGLGLGLAIVKNLTAMHGGVVTAKSDGPNRGSEFTIDLPASARQPRAPRDVSGHWVPAAPAVKRKKILVVDDNRDAADLLAEALQYEGYEVAVAHDGMRALEISESFVPDVAVLDIGLPVMDGNELARRLRQQHPRTDLRLIAATGYSQEVDRLETRSAGFEHHLVKPITLSELLALIAL